MARKLRPDWILFVTTLALVLTGVVMVFSSSVVLAREWYGDPNHFSLRHVIASALGLGAMFLLMKLDYHRLREPVVLFTLLSAAVSLLLILFALPAAANAHRWIRIAGFSFQPSELAKLAMVIFMAYFLEKQRGLVNDWRATLTPVAVLTLLICGLIALQPDLGTATAILAVSGLLLFAAGLHGWWLAAGLAVAVPAFVAMIVFVPWRLRRIFSFLDPWADPLDSGYQLIQSLISVGAGGVTGVGFMEGQQKLFYLPEPHTDFIFAVVGEEFGLLGTLFIVLLFGVFLWRGVRSASRAPDLFGVYLALGLTMVVVLQAAINMSVVIGLLPTKGIPLPFLSSGGSSMLTMLAGVGVLLNVSQHSN